MSSDPGNGNNIDWKALDEKVNKIINNGSVNTNETRNLNDPKDSVPDPLPAANGVSVETEKVMPYEFSPLGNLINTAFHKINIEYQNALKEETPNQELVDTLRIRLEKVEKMLNFLNTAKKVATKKEGIEIYGLTFFQDEENKTFGNTRMDVSFGKERDIPTLEIKHITTTIPQNYTPLSEEPSNKVKSEADVLKYTFDPELARLNASNLKDYSTMHLTRIDLESNVSFDGEEINDTKIISTIFEKPTNNWMTRRLG